MAMGLHLDNPINVIVIIMPPQCNFGNWYFYSSCIHTSLNVVSCLQHLYLQIDFHSSWMCVTYSFTKCVMFMMICESEILWEACSTRQANICVLHEMWWHRGTCLVMPWVFKNHNKLIIAVFNDAYAHSWKVYIQVTELKSTWGNFTWLKRKHLSVQQNWQNHAFLWMRGAGMWGMMCLEMPEVCNLQQNDRRAAWTGL